MPPRAPHYCSGCNQQTRNAGQCDACKTLWERRRWNTLETQRPTASKRGYGGTWALSRTRFLRANPTCTTCGDTATVADHITPRVDLINAGTPDPDAWHRLQPLCAPCHLQKTRQEIIARQRGNQQ